MKYLVIIVFAVAAVVFNEYYFIFPPCVCVCLSLCVLQVFYFQH